MKRALFILACSVAFSAIGQNGSMRLTNEKDFDFANLPHHTDYFIPADTTTWMLVLNRDPNTKLADIAESDGMVTIKFKVNDRVVSRKVSFASGSKKASKAGRFLAAAGQSNMTEGFYFKLLPTKEREVTAEWREMFADLIELSKEEKPFKASVHLGEDWNFWVELTVRHGLGVYAEWGKEVYDARMVVQAQEEARLEEENAKKVAEQREKDWIARLDEGDLKVWLPSIFYDKELAKKMEAAVRQELASTEKVFKVYLVERNFEYNKNVLDQVTDRYTFFWAAAKSKDGYYCYLREGLLTQQHLGGGQFTSTIEVTPTLYYYMRCEHFMAQLKKNP